MVFNGHRCRLQSGNRGQQAARLLKLSFGLPSDVKGGKGADLWDNRTIDYS